MTGIIGDWFLEHYKEFCEKYKDLANTNLKEPPDVLFNTKLGLLARLFTFILTGKSDDVKKCINILIKINDPYEIIEKTTPRGKFIYKRFEKLNKEYERILKDAIENNIAYKKILLYTYTSKDTSFTGVLANELIYKFPDKVVIVARDKDDGIMRLSLRSNYKGNIILPELINKLSINIYERGKTVKV